MALAGILRQEVLVKGGKDLTSATGIHNDNISDNGSKREKYSQ